MNDRFKFRVWDAKYKMYMKDSIPLHQDGTLLCAPTDGFVIEQCTGLTDKNGKLIYEGDLLGDSKEDDEFIEICWCNTLASFMYDIYPETYGNLETCDAEYLAKFEIIGNIHEMEMEQ